MMKKGHGVVDWRKQEKSPPVGRRKMERDICGRCLAPSLHFFSLLGPPLYIFSLLGPPLYVFSLIGLSSSLFLCCNWLFILLTPDHPAVKERSWQERSWLRESRGDVCWLEMTSGSWFEKIHQRCPTESIISWFQSCIQLVRESRGELHYLKWQMGLVMHWLYNGPIFEKFIKRGPTENIIRHAAISKWMA